ncbi:MAG: hypothetical protein J6Z47_00195 [Bacteroidales bacterium]|nr:hypothetical protein [Bacteroidales bacterium]
MKPKTITGKLLSVLAGVLLAASCTNYGEDIADINNRLDALSSQDIASMKAQLASMSSTINGISSNIGELTDMNTGLLLELSGIKTNITTIQNKIGTLLTEEDFNTYKAANEATIRKLNEMIINRVSQAELQTLRDLHSQDMTDLLAQIRQCVTKADLDKAVAEATSTYANDISRLESLVATMLSQSDFDTFRSEYSSQLAQLTNTINQALATKLDTLTYKQFLEQYGQDQADMQTAINQAVAGLVESIQDMLTKSAFELFQSEINATLEKLEAKIDSLAGTVSSDIFAEFKQSVENAIGEVRTSVSDLEEKQGEAIDSLKTGLGEVRSALGTLGETLSVYQEETSGALASLQASVTKFDQKVDTSVFNAFKSELDSALVDLNSRHNNDIQELRTAMNRKLDASEFAEFQAVYDSSMAAVNLALSTIVSSEEVAQFKKELDEIRKQLKPAVDSLHKVVDTLSTKVATLENTTASLVTAIEESTRTLTGQIEALDARVTELENKFDILSGKVDKLVSRIQSVMYIPDYSDRQVLLESSGSSYKRSTIKFEVRPAALAKAIAAAYIDGSAEIRFITREISTRAATASMDITGMTADDNGVLTVNAIFEPEESTASAFAVALYIKDEEGNDITSDYLTVVRKTASEVSDERILGRWILYRYQHINTANGEWGEPELVEAAPAGSEFSYIRLNTGDSFVSNLPFGEIGVWTLAGSRFTVTGSSASASFTVEELTSDSMTLITSDGKTKWLWIKTTQPDPYFAYGNFFGYGIKFGDQVWAPVNLGYRPKEYPQGLLFQWGRQDGQGYSDATYQDASVPSVVTGTATPETALANTFYRVGEAPMDWNTEPSDILWRTSAGTKGAYDPCPAGWRVPLAIEFNLLVSNARTKWWSSLEKGYVFYDGESTITLPAAGQRAGDTPEAPASGRGQKGFYWTSVPTGTGGAYSLSFDIEGVKVGSDYPERQRGMAVRCVKE